MSSRARAAVALTAAGALAAAGVATQAGAASTQVRRLSASKTALKFSTTRITARPGRVQLVMGNPSSFPHAIAVEGRGLDRDGRTVGKGGTSRVTATLKRGTYTFYCPVDGHRQAGMRGRLVVR